MKDARIYLIHVRECLTRIENYTQNGQNDFMSNILIQDAVLRNLEVMGNLLNSYQRNGRLHSRILNG